MFCKAGFLLVTVLVGSYAFPLEDEQDMSIFFGHSDLSPCIVGGTQAGSVPHMVALTIGNPRNFFCGGSLVSTRHVLTAAHCIQAAFSSGSLSGALRGAVGSNRWNSGGEIFTFSGNFTHPNFDTLNIKNDIGILVTTNAVALNKAVSLVRLSYDFIGQNVAVRVHGWGRMATRGNSPATLMELRSKTVEGNRCVKEVRRVAREISMGVPAVQPHIEICVFVDASKGTCYGDSGSALLREDNAQQIGVVSWGVPCAHGAPDVFARVSAFQSWIRRIIG